MKTPHKTTTCAGGGNYFSGMNGDLSPLSSAVKPASDLGSMLCARKYVCAVAESCTGGMLGGAITAIAGSSAWFRGGVIAYSNDVKMRLLGVPEQVLAEHGAVSGETVVAMAAGTAKLLSADCAIAVSGIAGPDGGSADKPVGLVFIGTWVCGAVATFRHVFPGGRAAVREAAVHAAIEHLTDQLQAPMQGPAGS